MKCVDCKIALLISRALVQCELCKDAVCVIHIKAHREKHNRELAIHNQALNVSGGLHS